MLDLPDELLIRIFQRLPFISKVNTLPRVCRRWKQLSFDNSLWNVIDIPTSFAINRSIVKILKLYANPYTRVLRITCYPPNDRPSKLYANRITSITWDTVLRSCIGLEELYICAADVGNLTNLWLLPPTIRRIFIINSYNTSAKKGINMLLTNPVRHGGLELLDVCHTPHFFFHANDLRTLSKCKSLKYVGLSSTCRMYGEDLKHLRLMTQLTHLDIHGPIISLCHEDIRLLINALINLEKLDISETLIHTLDRRTDFSKIWAEVWAGGPVPNLTTIKLCLVKFRNASQDVNKYWFELDSPFRDRFDFQVIGCKVIKQQDHQCTVKSILPAPVTHIPM